MPVGICKCSHCGYEFKVHIIDRYRQDLDKVPSETIENDEVIAHTAVSSNGIPCYKSYCPKCGLPTFFDVHPLQH